MRHDTATLLSSLLLASLCVASATALAQGGASGPMQEASRLDTQGATKDARAIFQGVLDTATVSSARAPKMAAAQERFYPYLTGYVALYTGDLTTAEVELTRALAMQGNQGDPFMHVLLAMTHEQSGHADKAKLTYEKAYALATAHSPPSAFARPFARGKLGLGAR